MELGLHDLLSLPKRLFVKGYKETRTKTTGERVRLFLEELGPTFVKLGQFASTRSDVLPPDIILELEKLQNHVPPFAFEDVKDTIEGELGGQLKDYYTTFQETPLAAASIGQVHYATLHSGEAVAVKVQRPNITSTIKTDLEILEDLAMIAESRLEWAARYKVQEIIQEFSKSLQAELNYAFEGRSAVRIANQFKEDEHIHIPKVYWDYTTKKVLTMEYVQGIKLNDDEQLNKVGADRKLLAERVVRALFHQVFIEGFFHGDPHPGNIVAKSGNSIIFMDFGLVGRITPDMKKQLSDLVIALMRQDTDGMIKVITRMGVVPEDVNYRQLRKDLDQLRDKYYDLPFSQVSIGEAVNDLFSIAYQHQIRIPADLTLLGKTLLTIEGMVEKLDPDLSIIKMAEPFGKQLLKERYHPKRVAGSIWQDLAEYGEVISELPKNIQDLKAVVQKGKIRMEISMPELDQSLKKLDRISNRLSFSIVLLSFSIIMVGLIVGSALMRQSTLLWDIPVIEVGFIIAILMFLWILFAIFKSGRF